MAVVRLMLRSALAIVFATTLGVYAPAQAQLGDGTDVSGGKATSFPKTPGGIFGPTQKFDKALPLYLQGDELVYDTKGNKTIARGNVEIFYNDNILTADEVVYDQNTNTLSATGNVVLKEKNGNIIRAERYTLTDDFRDGFVQSLSIVARDDTRIAAEQATRREGNVTEFKNARFTPCKSDGNTPPLWCIGAKRVTHDQAAATISYQDAQFELLGYPVLFLPYFQHPDPSVKRKSGFLAPTYGNSGDLGLMLSVPYYYAIAPNADFTFNPTYLSKQGVLWQGDFRHKLETGQYSIKISGIDQDAGDLPDGTNNRNDLEGWRGSVETKGLFSLSSWWSYGWDVTLESDDTFRRFYKLDNILLTDRINNVFLRGMSDRNYFGVNLYQFGGLLVVDTDVSESLVHPVIDYNYVFADPVFGGELKWDTNVLSLSRSYSDKAANIPVQLRGREETVNRAVTELKWRRRLTDTIGISYTPFGELRGDLYYLDNYVDASTGTDVEDDAVARGLATGGVTVSYPWIANGANSSHTVEPIGQIIARQSSVRQDTLPDEDARSLVFDDTNLFETNKFSGYDRVETGTRANVGVQYTFQHNSGGYARLLAGQSFHLSGENAFTNPGVDSTGNPIFNPDNGLATDRSDYVLGLYVAPSQVFRLLTQARFDEDDLQLRRQNVTAFANIGPFSLNTTYSYTSQDPEFGLDTQQDVSAVLGLQLTDRWLLAGGLRYDIDAGERLTDSVQLRYLDECFMLSVTYAETFITNKDKDIEPDQTVMFRIEFKHLGGFASKTDVLDHLFSDQQAPN